MIPDKSEKIKLRYMASSAFENCIPINDSEFRTCLYDRRINKRQYRIKKKISKFNAYSEE